MIVLILRPSCLIHQQIRAEWVPAARSCRITSLEIGRICINLLVTDVILLFIMLAGLLRLRRGAGGSFYLSHLLWKQVEHSQFLLAVVLLSHRIRHSSGCHLARYCHRRRDSANGKPDWIYYCTYCTAFLYLSPFYTVVAPFI